jgi:hypothetical protein
MMDTGEMSAISEAEGRNPHASQLREVKKLNEFVEVFRELHLVVHNDIMTLKNKGYGPQTLGGRDDPPILGEASRPQKLKAVRDTPVTTTSTGTSAKCYMCGRLEGHLKAACTLSNHPDCNRENVPWLESEKGRAWKAYNRDTLPQDPHNTLAAWAARQSNTEEGQVSGGTQNRSPPREFRAGGRGRGQNRKRDRESPPKQTGMLSFLGVLDTINATNHQ